VLLKERSLAINRTGFRCYYDNHEIFLFSWDAGPNTVSKFHAAKDRVFDCLGLTAEYSSKEDHLSSADRLRFATPGGRASRLF